MSMLGYEAFQYFNPEPSLRTTDFDGISYPILGNYRRFDDVHAEKNPLSHGPNTQPGPIVCNRDQTLTIYLRVLKGSGIVEPDYNILAATLNQYPHALLNIWISKWDINTEYCVQPRVLYHHLQLIYANRNRWNALRIDAHLFNYLVEQDEWKAIGRKEATNLKWLTIDELARMDRVDIKPLCRFVEKWIKSLPGQKLPNLEIASNVYDCKLYRPGAEWPININSKHIQQFPFGSLCNLSLTPYVSGATVYEVLKASCRSIEQFYAAHIVGPPPARNAKVVHMPKLRCLGLYVGVGAFDAHDTGYAWDLLKRISTVSIRELAIGYEDEWDSQAFDKFQDMIQSGRSLESLRLEKMSLDSHDLKRCLARNNGLKELAVDCQADRWQGRRTSTPIIFNREICELFSDEKYLPYLATLVVGRYCIEDSGCFGLMVYALASYGLKNLAIVCLAGDKLNLSRYDLDIIRSLGINVQFRED